MRDTTGTHRRRQIWPQSPTDGGCSRFTGRWLLCPHSLSLVPFPCCVQVEIISNNQGNRTTPSYVAFTDNERLVGEAAKNQASSNPKNTVFDAKRLIGRNFDDKAVQGDMKVRIRTTDKRRWEGGDACLALC